MLLNVSQKPGAHGSPPNQARSRGEDQLTDTEMMGMVKTREGLNSRVGRRFLGILWSPAQLPASFIGTTVEAINVQTQRNAQTKSHFHFHSYLYSQEHTNTAQNYNCHIMHGKHTSKNGSRKENHLAGFII